jgi:cytochrome P450
MTSTIPAGYGAEPPAPNYPTVRTCPFDPPPELATLRAENPISRIRIWDGSSPWLVTRYADVRSLLCDPRVSADVTLSGHPSLSPGFGDFSRIFVGMDDPEHARYRKMVHSDFTVRGTEAWRPLVEKLVNDLLDAIEREPRPVDLVEAFALPLPSMVICHMLGVPYADHDFFQSRTRVIADTTLGAEIVGRAVAELREFLMGLIAAKEAEPADDVLSRLAERYVRTGELSRDDAVAMTMLLLGAGFETTANMISLGTLTLLRHPEQAAEVRDGDPAVVKGAVEELMRLLTVTQASMRRVAREDIEVGGVTIRAGDGIVLSEESANRDSTAFESPDELDIHRDANRHLAFGFGVHQCLGQPLARLELQLAYPALLRRFPNLHVAVPPEELRYREKMVVYGVEALPVSW